MFSFNGFPIGKSQKPTHQKNWQIIEKRKALTEYEIEKSSVISITNIYMVFQFKTE
jgi:hypothetical protein